MNDVTRRRFLTVAGGAGLALAGCSGSTGTHDGSGDVSNLARADASRSPEPVGPPSSPSRMPDGGRVLVVVQMAGGNDGLNTLVPADGRYRDARPTLAIPETDLITLAGTDAGLHPSLEPLAGFWERGDLAAMQAIGLPEQSRSHFVALDTWWAGTPATNSGGGWLGRWLDATAPAETNPVRAVALGGGSPALVGQASSPAIVQSLDGLDLRDRSGGGVVTAAFEDMGGDGTDLLGRARAAIPTTLDAIDQLGSAITVSAGGDLYAAASPEALFGAVADIIRADIGTEVILVNLGGYDTHANQLGVHALLLRQLADGLSHMFDRLAETGDDDRVLAITFSEFGRRVAENGSAGTDHGQGGVAFLLGPGVSGGQIVGTIDFGVLADGDVPIDVDARSLYANALGWLGGPTDDVLGGRWASYGLVTG